MKAKKIIFSFVVIAVFTTIYIAYTRSRIISDFRVYDPPFCLYDVGINQSFNEIDCNDFMSVMMGVMHVTNEACEKVVFHSKEWDKLANFRRMGRELSAKERQDGAKGMYCHRSFKYKSLDGQDVAVILWYLPKFQGGILFTDTMIKENGFWKKTSGPDKYAEDIYRIANFKFDFTVTNIPTDARYFEKIIRQIRADIIKKRNAGNELSAPTNCVDGAKL